MALSVSVSLSLCPCVPIACPCNPYGIVWVSSVWWPWGSWIVNIASEGCKSERIQQERQKPSPFYELELTLCSFHHTFETKSCPIWRRENIDSTPQWKEYQSHIAWSTCSMRVIVLAIYGKYNLPHYIMHLTQTQDDFSIWGIFWVLDQWTRPEKWSELSHSLTMLWIQGVARIKGPATKSRLVFP